MIPRTKHGLSPFACISALQKYIRRAMEVEAMQVAVEMMHTSKAFHSMVTKRLQVISHEDIDAMSQPNIIPFVRTACQQANEWYDADPAKLGKSRMAVGNAIRLMCRSMKSREADHFNAAIGWAEILENFTPTIPDWVLDQHTTEGRKKGRGLDYFREHSTKLKPAPKVKDDYEDEAYRLWALKAEHAKQYAKATKTTKGAAVDLFDEAEDV